MRASVYVGRDSRTALCSSIPIRTSAKKKYLVILQNIRKGLAGRDVLARGNADASRENEAIVVLLDHHEFGAFGTTGASLDWQHSKKRAIDQANTIAITLSSCDISSCFFLSRDQRIPESVLARTLDEGFFCPSARAVLLKSERGGTTVTRFVVALAHISCVTCIPHFDAASAN
jgi:hypothetical protein